MLQKTGVCVLKGMILAVGKAKGVAPWTDQSFVSTTHSFGTTASSKRGVQKNLAEARVKKQ